MEPLIMMTHTIGCMVGLAMLSTRLWAADTWQSELYNDDWLPPSEVSFYTDKVLQDFSYAGYAMGERLIPELKDAAIFDATRDFDADPTGTKDSTAAIQQAIDAAAAAGGGVVYLGEGTYRVSPQGDDQAFALRIGDSGIVLRGAGAGRTFLLNTATYMRSKSIILVEGKPGASWKEEQDSVPITQKLSGPTTTIPVETTEPFHVGEWIILRNDPTTEWIKEHQEPDWLGFEERIGNILYLRRIVAIDPSANVLEIDIPTRYTLNPRDGARVYKKEGLLSEIGVEALSIGNIQHPGKEGWESLDFAAPDGDYTRRLAEANSLPEDFAAVRKSAYDVHSSYAIAFRYVVDGWIRDVDTFRADGNTTGAHLLSNGIVLRHCRNVTVEDCHFQLPQYGGGGGNGYMFRLDNTNECLLTGCIAESSRHGYSISGMASSGNVLHRCHDRNTARQTGSTGQEVTGGRGSDHHQWFSHSNLIDASSAENSWFEARYRHGRMSRPQHNITSAHTVFWNTLGVSNSFHPFVVWSQQGRFGYVIGTRGARPEVRTDGELPDITAPTDPVDHVEGIGKGDTLEPFSLFEDQRKRRLASSPKKTPEGVERVQ